MAKKNKKGSSEKDQAKAEKKKKQELKAQKKASKKNKKTGADDDEDDLDAILAELRQKDAERNAVTIEVCSQPSPRSNFSLSPLEGQNSNELLLFGGELFDGNSSYCYNDLFRLNLEKLEWKQISSPNTPDPRNAHQAVTVRDHVYIFGGEFSRGYQFHHYRDLWKLNLVKNEWTHIETKSGPSPRSGHRMVLWKHFLILFGGFYETSRGVKFYDDLYAFDLREEKWHLVVPSAKADPTPGARSGFQMVCHASQNMILVYGGYAKVMISTNSQRGRNLDDMWGLYLTMPPKTGMPPSVRWQRIPSKGSPPSRRSGATSCVYKNRMLLFGGVTDNETANDVIGEFHNSLYSFDMDRMRWYKLEMKASKTEKRSKPKRKSGNDSKSTVSTLTTSTKALDIDSDSDSESDFENENENDYGLDDNAFYVMIDGKITKIDYEDSDEEAEDANLDPNLDNKTVVVPEPQVADTEIAAPIPEESCIVEEQAEEGTTPLESGEPDAVPPPLCPPTTEEVIGVPRPRIGAGLAILGNRLFVFGGTCEEGDRQMTFDDLWCVDVNKMDGWTEVVNGTWRSLAWKGDDDDDDEEEDDSEEDEERMGQDDEDDDDEEDDDEDDGANVKCIDENDIVNLNPKALAKRRKELQDKLELGDESRTPHPKETLREFFRRTVDIWLHEFFKLQTEKLTGKEIRRGAFHLARERYDIVSPILEELDAIEEEQKMAEELQMLREEKMRDKLKEKAKKRKAHLAKMNKKEKENTDSESDE